MKKLLFISLALLCQNLKSQTTANWTSGTSGTLNGVAFTVTSVNVPGVNFSDFSWGPFSAEPLGSNESCLLYRANSSFTFIFASPIPVLRIYMRSWQVGDFEFNEPFTAIGSSGYTVSGNFVHVSAYADGIIEFNNPVTTLTMTSNQVCCKNHMMTMVVPSVPLPVELISFEATCSEISWSTATEINNDHFTIFYSDDDYIWEEYTTVDGHGNSNANNQYRVFAPIESGYYKLTQTDFDGKTEVLGIEHVECDEKPKKEIQAIFNFYGKYIGNKLPVNTGMYIIKYKDGSFEKKASL